MEKDLALIKTLLKKAFNLNREARFNDSIALLMNTSDIWMDYSERWKFLTLLGTNNFKLGNYDRAERIFLESLSVVPENIKALDILGKIYLLQTRYIEAERVFHTARKYDFYNYNLSIKMALSAWKSGSIGRMFKRLKEGYNPNIIGDRDEKRLKDFLLDFLENSNSSDSYILVKNFRKWCYEIREKTRAKQKNKSIIF